MESTYDVIVVGAGGAGMTAALAAKTKHGLETVVIEKSSYFGGSTSRSGGGVWIPGNYALKAAGQVEPGDADAAKLYLESIVGDVVPRERRDTYVDRGPEVLEFLRAATPVRLKWVPDYADYHPEAPGGRLKGRSVEPVPTDARIIGDELKRLHPPYAKAPANMVVTQADFRKMATGFRTIKGPLTMVRVGLRKVISTLLGRRLFGMGAALAISLRKGLMDAQVPVLYEHELTDLIVEGGRVVGIRVSTPDGPKELRARKGVILGSGGFEHNQELRDKWQPAPQNVDWSTGAPSNTGAGILAGIAAGAATDLLDEAWWGPTIMLPGRSWFLLSERNLPGSFIVNAEGRRFMNEALPYVEAVHEIQKGQASGVEHVPSWMIFDQTYRSRYIFAGLSGQQPIPGRWFKEEFVVKSESIEGLAERIGVPAENLAATVERFNGFARTGDDEDFHRGVSGYDHYYSDPTVKPNCSLAPLDKAPFYAVKILPGDLGTKGGLVTDAHARVLRPDGSVIEGLWAAGNVSSAVMGRTYAGPGATIGPAMVFGYLAAEDLASA
ncbi:3-oxosteroid 1-dehydrogenase [Nocardioides sp. Kera G14]|uniref:3-oxosteroid 1-dehydrogenase n=1 Tax=Nocardioides sp. Kera G14 TaxID=2884264 RepID=UPI001D1111A8|nr:3-oxosteroid 1-dehydrogenase [Nocardioides sp. Kera G14]UDY22279.1 3-oxosteroid 1-dehydrogenase [Nocardioides sp. Kera G14]